LTPFNNLADDPRSLLDFDFTFPHSYEVEPVREWPGTGRFTVPVINFPPLEGRAEHGGLWLRVKTKTGKSWIGVFAFGYNSPPAFSRVVSSPDPDCLCVVSAGAAYIINVEEHDAWERIPIIPVLDVRALPEQKLLVFADFIRLAAYRNNKFTWRSPRVCWDDLKITNVSEDIIEGTGYDPTNAVTHRMRFVVEVRTGRSLLPLPASLSD
jgi:hypothetical protein